MSYKGTEGVVDGWKHTEKCQWIEEKAAHDGRSNS